MGATLNYGSQITEQFSFSLSVDNFFHGQQQHQVGSRQHQPLLPAATPWLAATSLDVVFRQVGWHGWHGRQQPLTLIIVLCFKRDESHVIREAM